MSRALTKTLERVSANNPRRKLSVPDVEEGPTANRIVQLNQLHVIRHFVVMCFSRTIAMVSQEEPEPAETSYLDAIINANNRKETKSWNIQSKWQRCLL